MGGASGRERRVLTFTIAGRRAKAPPTFGFQSSKLPSSKVSEGPEWVSGQSGRSQSGQGPPTLLNCLLRLLLNT